MWHDASSPWLILSIIVYGLILAWAVGASVSIFKHDTGRPFKAVAVGLVIIVVPSAIFNGLTYLLSDSFPSTASVQKPDVTESFGFKSGQTYPLIAGERFGGSVVNAQGRRWSFTIQSVPASAISVSFAGADNKFYIFDIPLNKIVFTQQEGVEPTMTLNLRTDDINEAFREGDYSDQTPCQKGFKAFMLACRSQIIPTYTVKKDVVKKGLSPLVMDYLDSAQMTVTPKMYNKILGKDG